MIAELVEWRLQRYLLAKQAVPRRVCSELNHSGGKPIVMLDRRRYPNLPEGDVELLVDGQL